MKIAQQLKLLYQCGGRRNPTAPKGEATQEGDWEWMNPLDVTGQAAGDRFVREALVASLTP